MWFKIFLAGMVIYGLWALYVYKLDPHRLDYMKFMDSSRINGTIVRLDYARHQTGMHINNNPNEFIFWPSSNEKLNHNTEFMYIATAGDSVKKEPYGDTIFLFHQGEVLKYLIK